MSTVIGLTDEQLHGGAEWVRTHKDTKILDTPLWVLISLGVQSIEAPEWVPVSERLPEDMQRVLIWFEYYRYGDFNCMYQTYGFGYVCDGKWSPFINGETGWKDARIFAWMPLPEPYKVESEE